MKQTTLSMWLKCILVGVAVCALAVYALIIPAYGTSLKTMYPEFSNRYWPWLSFIWMTAIPCLAAFVLGWQVADSIGKDQSFSNVNASRFKWIALLAGGDSAFFFMGNTVLLLAGMSHPGVMLMSLLVVFVGFAVSVAAAALSHLVGKAADLQEQSDLTI